jgi:hypothetical protein
VLSTVGCLEQHVHLIEFVSRWSAESWRRIYVVFCTIAVKSSTTLKSHQHRHFYKHKPLTSKSTQLQWLLSSKHGAWRARLPLSLAQVCYEETSPNGIQRLTICQAVVLARRWPSSWPSEVLRLPSTMPTLLRVLRRSSRRSRHWATVLMLLHSRRT